MQARDHEGIQDAGRPRAARPKVSPPSTPGRMPLATGGAAASAASVQAWQTLAGNRAATLMVQRSTTPDTGLLDDEPPAEIRTATAMPIRQLVPPEAAAAARAAQTRRRREGWKTAAWQAQATRERAAQNPAAIGSDARRAARARLAEEEGKRQYEENQRRYQERRVGDTVDSFLPPGAFIPERIANQKYWKDGDTGVKNDISGSREKAHEAQKGILVTRQLEILEGREGEDSWKNTPGTFARRHGSRQH
ncbi:hypothetical protein [Streptomyces sp. NPDC056663]|uniref:hypothetical protein n=1 Tax=Streptomyces sp. NPDC056663 TaxID=3345899 RepID=UPI00368E59E8